MGPRRARVRPVLIRGCMWFHCGLGEWPGSLSRPPVARWRVNAEALAEDADLLVILFTQFVACMNSHLKLGCQTPHRRTADGPCAGQTFGRICPRVPVVHLIQTTPLLVEGDRMDVH